jgi:RimJ/RimL family protein N-acetyltransferase
VTTDRFETDRLRLRRARAGDAARLATLNADPEVMRYIGSGARPGGLARAEAAAWLDAAGCHIRIIEDRASGEVHGWVALLPFDQGRAVELAYRLARPSWGRGIASEAARAMVGYAFAPLGAGLGLDRLAAITHPDNRASRRVLDKLGFRQRGSRTVQGIAGVLYYVLERATP